MSDPQPYRRPRRTVEELSAPEQTETQRTRVDGAALRAQLIASGRIVPAAARRIDKPTVSLDAAGRDLGERLAAEERERWAKNPERQLVTRWDDSPTRRGTSTRRSTR